MTDPDTISFLAIPSTEDDATRFVQAFRALCAFARSKRQELAMHNERMETTGVADPEVAASLKLLLGEAIAAERIAKRVEPMLDRAVFCPGRPKGGTA